MMKKTFVYDTSKGFSALLKHYYSEKMEIHNCYNKNKFKSYRMSDFEMCFFIVSEIEDLFLLRDIYFEIEHFFVIPSKNHLIKKIENLNFNDAVIIDFNRSKKDILFEIDFNLSHIMLNPSRINNQRNKNQIGNDFS